MFLRKFHKSLLVLGLFFVAQCYKAPFFDLTIQVKDQNFNPVENVMINIVAADVDSDNLQIIPGSNITDLEGDKLECQTNGSGECQFSFDKKAFVTIQACFVSNNNSVFLCQEAFVYLKEDENIVRELMLVSPNMNAYECSYCEF